MLLKRWYHFRQGLLAALRTLPLALEKLPLLDGLKELGNLGGIGDIFSGEKKDKSKSGSKPDKD